MSMSFVFTILSVITALLLGLTLAYLCKQLRLPVPDVTIYILAGILAGPFFLGRLHIPGLGFASADAIEKYSLLHALALGFIAFILGNECHKIINAHPEKDLLIIEPFQALLSTLLVDSVLLILHFILGEEALPMSVAITLGAAACATAPAATLMVIRQHNAKGILTDYLIPITALDEFASLFLFSISFGIARTIETGHLSVVTVLVNPVLELICSLLLGTAAGFMLSSLIRVFITTKARLAAAACTIFLVICISRCDIPLGSVRISFYPFLVCMLMGLVFAFTCPLAKTIMPQLEHLVLPLFALFFVLTGSGLNFFLFRSYALIIGIAYVLMRAAGKYFGTRFVSHALGCRDTVSRYLGLTLLPQAGVALDITRTARTLGTYESALIRSVIFFSIFICDLAGPILTSAVLHAAGEDSPQDFSSNRIKQ